MRALDFSSWQALASTLLGLFLVTLLGVGLRLIVMQTMQERRARENRQINERLRILIAAYKTLGGSFTGSLEVDPTHLRQLRSLERNPENEMRIGNDRARRTRDAVEAALSDIILLGTEEHVRLAAQAANELVSGKTIHTAELVVSLRNFIRSVLDLEGIAPSIDIPRQGPSRSSSTGAKGEGRREEGERGGGQKGGDGGGMGDGTGLHHSDEQLHADPHA